MYFKFVRHEPLYKKSGLEVNCPINFIVEAERARYQTYIVWQKDDLPPFHIMGDAAFAVGLPPQEDDVYPIEVVLLWVFKPNEKGTRIGYYGFDCDLYVMNDQGSTLDKLIHNPFGIKDKEDVGPVHPPIDWKAMDDRNESYRAGYEAGKQVGKPIST